ncbi:hypothetical protein D9M71_729890 [compost metagenome]
MAKNASPILHQTLERNLPVLFAQTFVPGRVDSNMLERVVDTVNQFHFPICEVCTWYRELSIERCDQFSSCFCYPVGRPHRLQVIDAVSQNQVCPERLVEGDLVFPDLFL